MSYLNDIRNLIITFRLAHLSSKRLTKWYWLRNPLQNYFCSVLFKICVRKTHLLLKNLYQIPIWQINSIRTQRNVNNFKLVGVVAGSYFEIWRENNHFGDNIENEIGLQIRHLAHLRDYFSTKIIKCCCF